MVSSHKGKFFIFSFLFFFSSLHVSSTPLDPQSCSIQSQPVPEPRNSDLNQEVLLNRLEELVRNLGDVVARLESKLPKEKGRLTQIKGDDDGADVDEGVDADFDVDVARSSSNSKRAVEDEGKFIGGARAKGMSVTKYTPFWSERFQFASAVKLDSDATCVNVLPFRDHEGLSKYVAVSDVKGRVFVFLKNGDVLVEFDTSLESPITAMISFISIYKNESFVVTGHENGKILMHRVWEGASGGEDYSSLFMENVGQFVLSGNREDALPVTILEVHFVGRMKYIMSSDTSGKIKVFKENGVLHGSVMPSSRPLVFLKQRLMFLTETGAASLDLRGMKIRESECEGLNHSVVRSYVFDATERSKAYGFTSDGDMVYVLLLGDVMNFKCRVRYKKKIDMDEPLAMEAIKGYLLLVNPEKVTVYNVSSPHYVRVGVPRPVFFSSLDELRSSFLTHPVPSFDAETKAIPLIATDREKLVVVGLGGGYVGMYHSNLPIFKGEYNTMLWTSPVLFFVLFLFGAWHFFAKKKEALTSWGPDDSVPYNPTSTATGAPLASNSGDRTFGDPPGRSSEVMDLRGGALRGPPRRYGSPTRYPGGATGSYRLGGSSDHNARPAPVDPDFRTAHNARPASVDQDFRAARIGTSSDHNARPPSVDQDFRTARLGSSDHNARPASVDPDFRATSELKYRATTMEPPGFPKRREGGLFGGNQVVNDRS